MEVQLIKKYEGLRMDQVITFKGKLKLNVDDIYQLNYILEDAEIVEWFLADGRDLIKNFSPKVKASLNKPLLILK